MSRAQLIKKTIGEAVREYGFEYTGYTRDEFVHGYTFLRKKEDIEQYIAIAIFDDEIRLEFATNAYGQEEVYASDLIESDFEGDSEGLIFEDEEELKQILCHFKEIILQKGLDILEDISKPVEARPKKETYRKLYQKHEILNEKYRKMYGLEETDSTVKLMQKISDIILENKDKEFAEVEELLIGLAAVFSDQLIRKCGGEWEWCPDANCCLIVEIHGRYSKNPLALMIEYWKLKAENLNWFMCAFGRNYVDIID